jgi:hypothetical protein
LKGFNIIKRQFVIIFGMIVVVLLLASAFAPQAQAVSYTGSLTGSGGGITATGPWNNASTTLLWTVKDVGIKDGFILWQYDYGFSVLDKDISHIIIEVSPTALMSDFTILSGKKPEVQNYGPDEGGNSNPNIPAAMTGIKLDGANSTLSSFSFTTTLAPVWGDFYAKDGKYKIGKTQYDVTAWNTGFTDTDPTDDPSNGSVNNHILRPDSQAVRVPEPTTLILLGTGITGIGLLACYRRMRRVK